MLVGVAFIAVGFMLMAGGGLELNENLDVVQLEKSLSVKKDLENSLNKSGFNKS